LSLVTDVRELGDGMKVEYLEELGSMSLATHTKNLSLTYWSPVRDVREFSDVVRMGYLQELRVV